MENILAIKHNELHDKYNIRIKYVRKKYSKWRLRSEINQNGITEAASKESIVNLCLYPLSSSN